MSGTNLNPLVHLLLRAVFAATAGIAALVAIFAVGLFGFYAGVDLRAPWVGPTILLAAPFVSAFICLLLVEI